MSRVTSPPLDDRSAKRLRHSEPARSESSDMTKIPENVIDIVPDGDAILIVAGMSSAAETPTGLRVSQHALSMASPVLKAGFIEAVFNDDVSNSRDQHTSLVYLLDDDGDAMYILINILHLRNDKLPTRILPGMLYLLSCLAVKYQCTVAARPATLQWFDRLYANQSRSETWMTIEAAYLLDEATFFARFTARWVLEQSLHFRQVPAATSMDTQQLALILCDRHTYGTITLRNDLDGLADACAYAFSKQGKHYIDWAPGMSPDATETPNGQPPVECQVDFEGAALYLGALRDARVWPSTTWEKPNGTIGDVVEKLKYFREPEYNDADKCECCEGIKVKFTEHLDRLKDIHKDRLWGLCLDCYKTGGVNDGECRYEHAKTQQAQTSGLGIKGI